MATNHQGGLTKAKPSFHEFETETSTAITKLDLDAFNSMQQLQQSEVSITYVKHAGTQCCDGTLHYNITSSKEAAQYHRFYLASWKFILSTNSKKSLHQGSGPA